MRAKQLWALAVLAALPLAAAAQSQLPKIEQVTRVGLPSGQGETIGRAREGAWMPVYVKIKAGTRGVKAGEFRLVAEAPDAEETPYRNVLPLPTLAANEDYFAITYLRTTSAEFQVWLETPDRELVPKSKSTQRLANEPVRGDAVLCLAIGGFPPSGLKRSLTPPKQVQQNFPQGFGPGGPQMKQAVPKGGPPGPPLPKDGGPVPPGEQPPDKPEDEQAVEERMANSYAFIGSVQDMPEHWYGYDAVDVVFLVTDSAPFLKDFGNARTRRQALVEWVRRGGKLVISVGNKAADVSELLKNMPLPEGDQGEILNCAIDYNVRRKVLKSVNTWAGYNADSRLRDVDIAKLTPGRGTRVLLSEPPEDAVRLSALYAVCGAGAWNVPVGYDAEQRPLVVDSACGLGRVMLVAFDLDARPFTSWPGQTNVWKRLREEMTPGLKPSDGSQGYNDSRDQLLRHMRSEVETFGDVPTVHFGWVALFIVVYIIIVGPLDYLLLAKVFKRLELTWLTFPTVVLTLSVGAYFGAYALKGDKRRFNKMDVVEIDLQSQQAYGTSWFAIFSPRIENYTIGVEPAFPGKALTPQNSQDGHSAVVTVLEAPQAINTLRTGSRSLFSRPYEYAPAASGLERVPIPVWSIRSFTASWRTPLPDEPPILATGTDDKDVNTLALTRQGTVTGTVKNNLPVTLRDVSLFYQGRWFQPPDGGKFDLAPGASFPVVNWSLAPKGSADLAQWQNAPTLAPPAGVVQKIHQPNGFQQVGYAMPPHTLAKELMFFSREKQNWDNSGLRRLDQAWRLQEVTETGAANAPKHYLDEVILVARTDFVPQDDAQKVNEKSLVRLWVGELPKGNGKAPPLLGQTTENTFVRVYIPVRPRK